MKVFEQSSLLSHVCIESRLDATDGDKVHCELFWRLTPDRTGNTQRCSDYSYLSPSDRDPFQTKEEGDVCVVRQVTKAQAKAGVDGWYYSDSEPRHCQNEGPAAMFPEHRPARFDAHLKCGIVKALKGEDAAEDVSARECVAPLRAASADDVGKLCGRSLFLSQRAYSIELGTNLCASDVCLTSPLYDAGCSETKGSNNCSGVTSRCSCRCAGESPDDPGPFCTCPEDYTCNAIVTDFTASPETRGSYCVPTDVRATP